GRREARTDRAWVSSAHPAVRTLVAENLVNRAATPRTGGRRLCGDEAAFELGDHRLRAIRVREAERVRGDLRRVKNAKIERRSRLETERERSSAFRAAAVES